MNRITVVVTGMMLASTLSLQAEDAGQKSKNDADIIAAQKPNYPLKTCVVSGKNLDGDMGEPVDYVYKGWLLFRFCCKSCIEKFEKNPANYLKTLVDAGKKSDADSDPPSAKASDSHQHGNTSSDGGEHQHSSSSSSSGGHQHSSSGGGSGNDSSHGCCK